MDTTSLTLIASPYSLIGDFPITIAVTLHRDLVCVGTAGRKNGVECFTGAVTGCLIADGKGLRSFGLSEPEIGPLFVSSSISDIWFSADLTKLYATVKGDGTSTSHGWLSVFPVVDGLVSTTEIRTVSNMTSALFGGFNNPYHNDFIFVSDAAFGAVVYEVDRTGAARVTGKGFSSPNVAGTCWARWSPVSEVAWVTSPTASTLFAFNVTSGNLIAQSNITSTNIGIIESIFTVSRLEMQMGLRQGL